MVTLGGSDCCGLGISLRSLKKRDSRVGERSCLRLVIDVSVGCHLIRFRLVFPFCLVDSV